MEGFKPKEQQTYYLNLDTQISSTEFVEQDGRKRIIIRDSNGKKRIEIIYDKNGDPLQMTQFPEDEKNNREPAITDPDILRDVDEQIKGLLGVQVEERAENIKPMISAVQDGAPTSMEKLKMKLLDENLRMGIELEKLKNPNQNPKGH